MNRGIIIAIASVAVLGLVLVFSYIGFYNNAVRLENAVSAQYESNKNSYDSFWKKISEMAQVPDKYKEDFKDVLVGNMEARYGDGGSKAQMQWIQEHSVAFDSSLYQKVMTAIESGRNDFRQGQDDLLDKQRVYKNHLQSFGGSLWAGFGGFPREIGGELTPSSDRDGDGIKSVLDYRIVTSKRTEAAFDSGEDEAIDVFGKK